jgi:hypothetical protein
MVVLEIGVIEIHAPPLLGRREATQEEHGGVLGKERLQRMLLKRHGMSFLFVRAQKYTKQLQLLFFLSLLNSFLILLPL